MSLNTSKELAERNLDVSPFQHTSIHDHKSIATKVAIGCASLIDYDKLEICPDHKGEKIIAMETNESGFVFGCNKCVFEKKLTKPVFLAYQARQTKSRIDKSYQQLTYNLQQVD